MCSQNPDPIFRTSKYYVFTPHSAICIFNMGDCCIKGFQWNDKPKGRDAKLGGRDCYVTGSNQSVAIMIIHDLFGWTFSNTRILADHYAQEVDATVYVPDL